MDITEFKKSKEVTERANRQYLDLVSFSKGEKKSATSLPVGQKSIAIPKSVARLGIFLMNGNEELRTKPNYGNPNYWSYNQDIEYGDPRLEYFIKNYNVDKLWDGENYSLLEFFFGEEIAPLVKKAWDLIPGLYYQRGYYRRSFRGPGLSTISTLNRLNYIIDLISDHRFRLSIEEYIIYDNELSYQNHSSLLWAIAINNGNEKIFNLLSDIIYNRHPQGKVSRGIIKAMLLSNRQDGWKAVEDLLLSAQRQEGLRQEILESLDETSVGAMKYMLKVIIDNKLSRFSSVVRAIDVWAGFGWEAEKESTVKRFLELASKYLENPALIEEGIKSSDNAEIYMSLWAQGVFDIEKCFPILEKLYHSGNMNKRTIVLFFVKQTQLTELMLKFGVQALEDESLQVLFWSLLLISEYNFKNGKFNIDREGKQLYSKILGRIKEIPKDGKLFEGKVFSWTKFTLTQAMAYSILINLTREGNKSDIDRIVPLFESMDLPQRESLTRLVLPGYYGYSQKETIEKPLKSWERDFALLAIKDRGEYVRSSAIRALQNAEVADDELTIFEEMLSRKNSELRKSLIKLILNKKEKQVNASATRLLESKNPEQRLAGLDILNQLKLGNPGKWVDEQAKKFAENSKISPKEQILLDNIIGKRTEIMMFTAENGYGLFVPSNYLPVVKPVAPKDGIYINLTKKNPYGLSLPADKVNQAISQLHELIIRNKNYEYETENWNNAVEKVLLGNSFGPIKRAEEDMTDSEKFNNYPLAELWKDWFVKSGLTACDLFLINLNTKSDNFSYGENDDEKSLFPDTRKFLVKLIFVPKIPKIGEYHWQNPIPKILSNLGLIFPFAGKIAFLEGLSKTIFSNIHSKDINRVAKSSTSWTTYYYTWRSIDILKSVYNPYSAASDKMTDVEFTNYWNLEKWSNYSIPDDFPDKDTEIASLQDYSRAFVLKLITYDELVQRVMKPDSIRALTEKIIGKNQFDYLLKFPFLKEILELCRNRILDIELSRGDSSTIVTNLAQNLQQIYGTSNFVKLMVALGKDTLHRGYIYSWGNHEYNKKEILSTLLKRCLPLETDTASDFNKLVKEAEIPDQRLIEAAMYGTQWLKFVANLLNMKGMESATWWLHAHTNVTHNAETETEIGRFSPVEMKDFQDGAVDIEWFNDAYKMVGKSNWKLLYDAAKYISDGTGHSRAKLYADIILENIDIKEVTKRISDKRNQDYVRVYGIIPLNKKNRDADLLNRYQFLQKFKKESKQFGSQRQASESLAVKIGMENLARTAGFSDPLRLSWAMETEEAQKILQSAKRLVFDDIEVFLSVDNQGKASIECTKNGKELKSIPSKLNKEKDLEELKEYCKVLKDQHSRTRKSLEEAMVNGEKFSIKELNNLMQHPVVKPMLQNLVLKSNNHLGFYTNGKIRSVSGVEMPMEKEVFIAHCTDLHEDGSWAGYQEYCFENEVVQPFKQIFRELYIPTEDELNEVAISRRYAGHQVQPKKTVALLKSRAWTVDYEEGLQKVFHKYGFIAKMYAMADWFSPADVESPTLETVEFIDRKTYKNIAFEKIDKRIFSEVMRDIDLVVSVAHVGDVDPEASHSSIEMRGVLVRETARLFKLNNVEVKSSHVLINGTLANYSVHLGSAVCHKTPAIYLSILPVHSQHRGRLFLPFLDDDPKSAEIMSKVLLLAKDNEIQDPTILRQIKS